MKLTQLRALELSLALWVFSMCVIAADQFSADWALIVTIIVALFGFILNLSVKSAAMRQKLEDMSKDLGEIKTYIFRERHR